MSRFALCLIVVCSVVPAWGQFADYAYVPPSKALGTAPGLPAATVSSLIARPAPTTVITDFAGMNGTLKSFAEEKQPLQAAEGLETDFAAADLFGDAFALDGRTAFLARVTSEDAMSLRLRLDLLGLAQGDEVWAVDPVSGSSHGPLTAEDALGEGNWTPVVQGDTVLVLMLTDGAQVPAVRVTQVAHFFLGEDAFKYDVCPIPVDCETDTTVQEVSTGIGRMLIPTTSGSQYLCSGALVNNDYTPELENIFLMANHCFEGLSVVESGISVYWDYRTSGCTTSSEPFIGTVPRTDGATILAANSDIDGELLQLNTVPIGDLGRAWLGWDARVPLVDDSTMGIHHPQGTHMKLSAGHVTHVDRSVSFGFQSYSHQTRVLWDEGITEGGSSGSPLLYPDYNYRVFGMLSNGAVHNCATPETNYDYYASFRHFFPEISIPLGGPVPAQQAAVYFHENLATVDTSGDGLVSFAEANALTFEVPQTSFDEIDANLDGLLSASELAAFLDDPGKDGTGCGAAQRHGGYLSDALLAVLVLAALVSVRRRARRG